MTTQSPSASEIVARVAASLLGGYTFVWGLSTLSIALLVLGGQAYDEAQSAVMLLAFLVFLWAFCWAFTAPRLRTVYGVLFGVGTVTSALAWWLAGTLI